MHILHLVQIYWPVPSGAARYFVEIGERLVRDGHRVTVLTTDAFDLEHFWVAGKRRVEPTHAEHHGVQVLRFPVRRTPGPPLFYQILRRLMVEIGRLPGSVLLLRRLAEITPRLPDLTAFLAQSPDLADVDLVHSTNITLDFAILPLERWARRRNLPHLCTPFVHLGEPGNSQIVRYYSMPHQIDILRRCDAVLTMTDRERNFLYRHNIAAERLHTVGAGVAPDEVINGNAQRFRAEHNIPGPIVLSLGTAAFDKGSVHVLEAMRRLWAAGSDAVWVQCGPLMSHFEQHLQTLSPAEQARIRVLGYVDNDIRRDALAAATVYAQPSRTDSFGITFLEAWCNAVPVVGADAGGIPAVVRHGVDGLLVPFGAIDALSSALSRLIHDHELARAMGTAGQRRVLSRFTWADVYQRVLTICLQNHRPQP
jgi:glycosyltransferase involved in cell wall biosynthesis